MRWLSLITMLCVVASGCVRSKTEMLAPAGEYAPVPPDSVIVFLSIDDVVAQGFEYERIAMLFIRADSRYTNESAILKRAREEAGKIGANGVILGETREPGFLQADRHGRILAIHVRNK